MAVDFVNPQALRAEISGTVAARARLTSLPRHTIVGTDTALLVTDWTLEIDGPDGGRISPTGTTANVARRDAYTAAALDGCEWGSYRPTFGLIAVDRWSYLRAPKPSARWLGAIARGRRLPCDVGKLPRSGSSPRPRDARTGERARPLPGETPSGPDGGNGRDRCVVATTLPTGAR